MPGGIVFKSAFIRQTRLFALVGFAAIAAACGTTQPSASPRASLAPTSSPTSAPTPTLAPSLSPVVTPAPTPTSAPAALLLEVTQEGGFIAPSAHLGQLPEVIVDTAGNIYMPDTSSTTDTLIPAVAVRNVGPEGALQILAAMKAAGLDKEGSSGVAGDAGVTVFTAEVDGKEIVNRVADTGPARPGASPQPAIDLLNRLADPSETWGASNVTTTPFTPTAYKVYAAPAPSGSSPTVTWPLSPVLSEFGSPATPNFGVDGLRSGAVTGANASTLATSLGTVAAGTFATSNGSPYQVWIRPLLPPEIS